MDKSVRILERAPTVVEYCELIHSVGFRRRDPRAIEIALGNSIFAVCAEMNSEVVGCGRVIGDGGLHFYLADIIVRPEYQRQGIGTRIVAALTRFVESLPYVNTVIGVMPTKGMSRLYTHHGYKVQDSDSPAMLRWINRDDQ